MCERDDEMIERAVRELRRPVQLDPAFDARVMETVRASGPGTRSWGHQPPVRRAWRWLVLPRPVRVSPLAGLAVAASIAALAVLGARTGTVTPGQGAGAVRSSTPVAAAAHSPAPRSESLVQFVLVAPGAHSVAVVGDFNDWQVGATPLRATAAGGVWTVEVPLDPGRHRYAFVVDGSRWTPDPGAPTAPGDDFGTPSSVVTVVERRT